MWHPNDIIWSPKGHLISKWFLGVINFLQKNERTLLTWYLRSTCFRSFLEEIDVPRNHFKIIWPLDGQLKLTYWIVNFFRYLMTTGTFCSLPIGIPVTVSTMKNLVVNSFLSFVLSLFCSLKDRVISEGFFNLVTSSNKCGKSLRSGYRIFWICRHWKIAILFFILDFVVNFTLHKLES